MIVTGDLPIRPDSATPPEVVDALSSSVTYRCKSVRR